MGVKGLWNILAPCGRRIKLESLEGKILAIDASIWVVQFIYAIQQGKISNTSAVNHLHGFMRRICKMLYFGIKPVFVFDGKTPALKKKTLIKRRQIQISRQDFDFKKAAERLVKKYLDQNLKEVKDQRKSDYEKNTFEVKKSTLTTTQQNIKETIIDFAKKEAERERNEQIKQEEDYEKEMITTLIIEYGMLLQENNVDMEEFSKLD